MQPQNTNIQFTLFTGIWEVFGLDKCPGGDVKGANANVKVSKR